MKSSKVVSLSSKDIEALKELLRTFKVEQTKAKKQLLEDEVTDKGEKIARYTFSLEKTFILGEAQPFDMVNSPLCDIKPDRCIFNAPCYNFATIHTLAIGNTSVIIGGCEDAFNYSNVAVDVHLNMPLCTTNMRAMVSGYYTGCAPKPWEIHERKVWFKYKEFEFYSPFRKLKNRKSREYMFACTLHGWARMST